MLGVGFTLRAVTTWADRIVAVGEVESTDDDTFTGEVWTSTDGRTWLRAPAPDAFVGASLVACRLGGDGLVVDAQSPGLLDAANPVTEWTTGDLETWRPLGPIATGSASPE